MITVIIAFVCAALAFPQMLWREGGTRILPDLSRVPPDTWQRIEEPGNYYHDMKNLMSEMVRSDSMWFAKFFCFVILSLIVIIIIQFFRRTKG